MSDIVDSLALIRLAFQREGLDPPTTLLLASRAEGMRFLSLIRQQANWVAVIGSSALGTTVKMSDGSFWMQVQVMGFNIRWPADRIGLPDGSWSYL